MMHNLTPIAGHEKDQTCTLCAACLRENGDWYLQGFKLQAAPMCRAPRPHRLPGAGPLPFRSKHQQVLQ
jgi:hypothetical protein